MLKKLILALHYFIIFTFLFDLNALASGNKSGTSVKIDKKGNLYMPALELQNAKAQKILIVGMSHVGFLDFYDSVNKYTNNWISINSNETVVLHEFFTCESSAYDNDNFKVNQQDVNSLLKHNIDFSPLSFMNQKEDQLKPLLEVFGMKKAACRIDVDGKTKRPSYYVNRNQKWCEQAKQNGGACQWLSFNIEESARVKNMQGDIKVDDWSAGMQFTASLLFGDYSYLDSQSEMVWSIFQNPSYVILDYRNYLVVNKAEALLNSGVSNIVLPWGAAHVVGLFKMLKERGFTQSNLDDIQFLSPSQFGRWDFIDQIYNSKDYLHSDHYEFQDEN